LAFRLLLELRRLPMSPQITVAPATSQNRIDANRRNAQKSTGPRTPEGKSRSRFNGLKHGLTAAVPVIPGEDPAVYEARLEAMIESSPPRNQVELDLLGRVAATTWSLERATRAEAAQISQRIKDEIIDRQRREEDEAIALGQRLFWDARGPWQAYPHKPQSGNKNDTLTSRSQDPGDTNTPALQIVRLERTVAGCRWLLDRWAELRARLETGEVWTAPDQFKAIRLLGKQPLDAIDDPEVTLICLACAKISPDGKGADAFAAIKNELRDTGLASLKDECSAYSKQLSKRSFANLQPPDANAAREALRALIDRQTARLKLILARNQEVAEARAADAPDRLAFDPSPEGEKLRRYLLSAARLANQTIKTFLSVVRSPLSVDTENSGAERESIGGAVLNGVSRSGEGEFASGGSEPPEPSLQDLRTERNAISIGMAPSPFDPEPFRHGGTAPQGDALPQMAGILNFPRPDGERVPEGRVRGSEGSPEPSARAPLQTEPNAEASPTFDPEDTSTNVDPRSARDCSFEEQRTTEDSFAERRTTMVDPHSMSDCSLPEQKTTEDSFAERRTTMVGPRSARGFVRSGKPAPLRTEPNTPPDEWQPSSSLTSEPILDGEEASELAQLNKYRAVLHSMIAPIKWPKMPPAERTKPKDRCPSRSRKPAKMRRQD
jgi:hypothetical protein